MTGTGADGMGPIDVGGTQDILSHAPVEKQRRDLSLPEAKASSWCVLTEEEGSRRESGTATRPVTCCWSRKSFQHTL